LASGCGVEALVLAVLDGHHALYKVSRHVDERGMLPLLQPALQATSVHPPPTRRQAGSALTGCPQTMGRP
jgi:hypothetical protein